MTQEAAPIAIAERTEYGVQRQHETDCESLEFLKNLPPSERGLLRDQLTEIRNLERVYQ